MKKGIIIAIVVVLILAAAGLGYYFLVVRNPKNMLDKLNKWADAQTTDSETSKAHAKDAFAKMSNDEIKDTYDFVFGYVDKKKELPAGALKDRIAAISKKYNIFS